MRTHVKVLGWLYIALGVLGVLGALAAFGVMTGVGLLSGEADAFWMLGILGTIAGTFLAVISLPNILCGVGLLVYHGWARILGMVLAVLNLANAPMGTVLGIYTFWVLLHEETGRLFEGG
jgi:hypothetical protein